MRNERTVTTELGGAGLQLDQARVAGRQAAGVGVPPARGPCRGRELTEVVRLLREHLVQLEKPLQVVLPDADLARLDPRDLRRRPAEPLRDVLAGQTRGLAERAQFAGELTFTYRWWVVLRHERVTLPLTDRCAPVVMTSPARSYDRTCAITPVQYCNPTSRTSCPGSCC